MGNAGKRCPQCVLPSYGGTLPLWTTQRAVSQQVLVLRLSPSSDAVPAA